MASQKRFEQQPQSLRDRVQRLSADAVAQADPTRWFEELYGAANGDTDQVPWAKLTVHPHIQDWLDKHANRDAEKNAARKAMVVGCGLGDDAEALQKLGFDVVAFDIAPTAIAWCRQRFPDSAVDYQVGDLFNPDPAWVGAFDLVVECRDIQALPLNVRTEAIAAVASLVASSGTLLVVTRLRSTEAAPSGPPWPLSEGELAQFSAVNLKEVRRAEFVSDAAPGVRDAWIEYQLEYQR